MTARSDFDTDVKTVTCPRCGEYQITDRGVETLDAKSFRSVAHRMSWVTRQASDRGGPVVIKQDTIGELLAAAPKDGDLIETGDRLLEWIGSRSHRFGGAVRIEAANDYPVICARDAEEFGYILDYLRDRDYVRPHKRGANGIELAPNGWERLERLRVPGRESRTAFVAMSFASEMKDAYSHGIRPAIEEAGYSPVRVDGIEHIDRIDDRIVAEIRRSRFVVADCTGQRGGVYFEAGFAMGLGLPVLWACRSDDVGRLHFDTRQYNHVVWETPADLRVRLSARILAALGPFG